MRILLTSHRFWPSVGGTEEVVERLAERYAAEGHDVMVATSDEPGAPAAEARGGYQIRRFTLKRVAKFRFPGRDYVAFVREGQWDVIHMHGQRVWSSDHLYRHFARIPAPIVFTAHGFYQWHVERTPILDEWYYKRVLPRALARTAAVIALTTAERDELVSFGVDPERIRMIPDGADLREFETLPAGFRKTHAFAEHEKVVLYVGGLYPNKRVDRCIDVAAACDATLAIVGRDAHGLGPALMQRAKDVGARVRMMGVLPRHEVLGAFREADLLILASDFEGFGLVLVEAMAAGLPFVATRAGAAPDLAARGGGLSVEPLGLVTAVKGLLADPAQRRAMGAAGKAAARDYAWNAIAKRYLALFEEVRH